MLDKKVKVKAIRELGADNYLLTVNTPEQARLVRPGQFVMLKCVEDVAENPLLRRPFTIFDIHRSSRSGKPAGLDLLIKDVGVGTRKLVQTRPGQLLDCLGPQGHGFQVTAEMRNRVQPLYARFPFETLCAEIGRLLKPEGLAAEFAIVFQTCEKLADCIPGHTGDWYFTGNYPTPGGTRVVNRALVNFMEKISDRAY